MCIMEQHACILNTGQEQFLNNDDLVGRRIKFKSNQKFRCASTPVEWSSSS